VRDHYELWDRELAMWCVTANGRPQTPPLGESGRELLDRLTGQVTPPTPAESYLHHWLQMQAPFDVEDNDMGDPDDGGEREMRLPIDRVAAGDQQQGNGEPEASVPPGRYGPLWLALWLWATVFNVPRDAMRVLLRLLVAFRVIDAPESGGDWTTDHIDAVVGARGRSARGLAGAAGGFQRFIICPGCAHVHDWERCYDTKLEGGYAGGNRRKRTHTARRCGNLMLRKANKQTRCQQVGWGLVLPCAGPHALPVQMLSVIVRRQPRLPKGTLVYPYMSVVSQLKRVLARPGVVEAMRAWTGRIDEEGRRDFMGDVVDGSVWTEFQHDVDGAPLLMPAGTHCLSALLFRPYSLSVLRCGR
jgi:hypothetical protein